MDKQDTPTAGDTAEKDTPPTPGDTGDAKDKTVTVPKARLDHEIAKRRAAEEQLDAVAKELEQEIPEQFRDLVPSGLAPAERIKWIRNANAKGVFAPAAPPATDQTKPKITKPAPNVEAMSATQKMAAGYGKRKE